MVDARQKDEQPVAVLLERGHRLAQARRRHGDPLVAGADAFIGYELFGDHYRVTIPWALMRSCRIISAFKRSSGRGGQPGM